MAPTRVTGTGKASLCVKVHEIKVESSGKVIPAGEFYINLSIPRAGKKTEVKKCSSAISDGKNSNVSFKAESIRFTVDCPGDAKDGVVDWRVLDSVLQLDIMSNKSTELDHATTTIELSSLVDSTRFSGIQTQSELQNEWIKLDKQVSICISCYLSLPAAGIGASSAFLLAAEAAAEASDSKEDTTTEPKSSFADFKESVFSTTAVNSSSLKIENDVETSSNLPVEKKDSTITLNKPDGENDTPVSEKESVGAEEIKHNINSEKPPAEEDKPSTGNVQTTCFTATPSTETEESATESQEGDNSIPKEVEVPVQNYPTNEKVSKSIDTKAGNDDTKQKVLSETPKKQSEDPMPDKVPEADPLYNIESVFPVVYEKVKSPTAVVAVVPVPRRKAPVAHPKSKEQPEVLSSRYNAQLAQLKVLLDNEKKRTAQLQAHNRRIDAQHCNTTQTLIECQNNLQVARAQNRAYVKAIADSDIRLKHYCEKLDTMSQEREGTMLEIAKVQTKSKILSSQLAVLENREPELLQQVEKLKTSFATASYSRNLAIEKLEDSQKELLMSQKRSLASNSQLRLSIEQIRKSHEAAVTKLEKKHAVKLAEKLSSEKKKWQVLLNKQKDATRSELEKKILLLEQKLVIANAEILRKTQKRKESVMVEKRRKPERKLTESAKKQFEKRLENQALKMEEYRKRIEAQRVDLKEQEAEILELKKRLKPTVVKMPAVPVLSPPSPVIKAPVKSKRVAELEALVSHLREQLEASKTKEASIRQMHTKELQVQIDCYRSKMESIKRGNRYDLNLQKSVDVVSAS